jgi:hypothetical protein
MPRKPRWSVGSDRERRLRVVLHLAAAATAVARARSAAIDSGYAFEEDERRSRVASRAAPTEHNFHPGPGLHSVFYPLFTPEGQSKLTPKRRISLARHFEEILRLDVKTFLHLTDRIGPYLKGKNLGSLKPTFVSVVALYYLATGCTFSSVTIAIKEGICITTVHRCVRSFTSVVVSCLGHIIRFPTKLKALQRCAKAMEDRSGIPGIIAAVDGSHVAVHPGQGENGGFWNYKHYYSVILSAVVDPRGYFMCVDCGFPGKMHDAGALKISKLWTHHPAWFSRAGFSIVGDAAYPLRSWLLTGFRNRNKTTDQKNFNTQGSRARVIAELAFGKLKGQWQCLSKGLETRTMEDWQKTIVTCCILHNLTIVVGGQGWDFDDKFLSTPRRDPGVASLRSDPDVFIPAPGHIKDSRSAMKWRETLVADLKAKGLI